MNARVFAIIVLSPFLTAPLLTPLQASAAPMPGVSTFGEKNSHVFYSDRGFRIDPAGTAWVQARPPKRVPSVVTVYRAPVPVNGQQPALTVRVDDLRHHLDLRTYIKHWMQDYSRFGFDVLTAKPIKVGETPAFLLDIVSRETKKQLRQVVFLKNRTAVILTCRDQKSSFSKTVQDCNQIIRTFQWTDSAAE
jgi:hypothetical protein